MLTPSHPDCRTFAVWQRDVSTQIGFYVIFETSLVSLVGVCLFKVLRWLYFIPGVLFAGVADVDRLWVRANIAVAAVSIPNLVTMLCLSGVFVTLMRDELSGERAYATAKVAGDDVVLCGIRTTSSTTDSVVPTGRRRP